MSLKREKLENHSVALIINMRYAWLSSEFARRGRKEGKQPRGSLRRGFFHSIVVIGQCHWKSLWMRSTDDGRKPRSVSWCTLLVYLLVHHLISSSLSVLSVSRCDAFPPVPMSSSSQTSGAIVGVESRYSEDTLTIEKTRGDGRVKVLRLRTFRIDKMRKTELRQKRRRRRATILSCLADPNFYWSSALWQAHHIKGIRGEKTKLVWRWSHNKNSKEWDYHPNSIQRRRKRWRVLTERRKEIRRKWRMNELNREREGCSHSLCSQRTREGRREIFLCHEKWSCHRKIWKGIFTLAVFFTSQGIKTTVSNMMTWETIHSFLMEFLSVPLAWHRSWQMHTSRDVGVRVSMYSVQYRTVCTVLSPFSLLSKTV